MGLFDRFRNGPDSTAMTADVHARSAGGFGEDGRRTEVPEPVTAAIVPLAAYDWSMSQSIASTEADWQRVYRIADRDGPGFVGAASNMPALTSAMVGWTVQHRNRTTQVWEDASDDAVAMATLRLFQGDRQDLEGLVRRMTRMLDGPGELIGVRERVGDRHVYSIVSKPNMSVTRDGRVEIKTRPNAPKGSVWHRSVPQSDVMHVFNEDEEWPGMPTSPFQRVKPDLDGYRLVLRSLGRHYKSKLLTNGIMWAQATAQATSWPDEFSTWARHSALDHADADVRSLAPFPLNTASEPKWIRVGAEADPEDRELADWFLQAYARGTDLPIKMLTEGPGNGTHWSDFVTNTYYAQYVMFPRMATVANLLTQWVLRPWGRTLSVWGDRNPDDFRVWFDLSRVENQTDDAAKVLSIPDIATRQARAEAAGLRPDQIMELPPGVSEAEWYMAVSGKTFAQFQPAARSAGPNAGQTVVTGQAPTMGDTPATDGSGPPGADDAPQIVAGLETGVRGFVGEEWDRDADLILT